MPTHSAPIRPARSSDLDDLARVRAQAVVASPFYDDAVDESEEFNRFRPRIVGYFAGTYHPSFAQSARTVVVADGGTVIGFGAAHESTRLGCTGELQWMFIPPQWQRKGIGLTLLKSLADWFAQVRSTRVIVDAPPGSPGRAFYTRYGALALDEYWLYWPDICQSVSN